MPNDPRAPVSAETTDARKTLAGNDRLQAPDLTTMVFHGRTSRGVELSFSFTINPSQLQISLKKLGVWKLTKFGYERQNWGNDLALFAYTGVSGVFRPNTGQSQRGVPTFDIRQTDAYQKLRQFEDFFLDSGNGKNIVHMDYWGYSFVFEGSLDEFQMTHNVEKDPYAIRYNFKFTGVPTQRTAIEVGYTSTEPGDPATDNERVEEA